MTPTKEQVIDAIRTLAPQYGLDPELIIRQCEAESSFDQSQVSDCGALGLMQLMPATAAGLCIDPTDWQQNLAGGMKYMSQLLAQFRDYSMALAAYNCGPGRLSAILRKHGDDWRAHVPESTKDYLRKILEASCL